MVRAKTVRGARQPTEVGGVQRSCRDDAPGLDDVKGYLVRELTLDLDEAYQIWYTSQNGPCFTLTNIWNSTKNGWRIVKDMYKDKCSNLEALEKDYSHAFVAMHFRKEFLDYTESSNVD